MSEFIRHEHGAGSYSCPAEAALEDAETARLIAAAPELLAACRIIVEADYWPRPLGAPSAETYIIRAAELARAAIAKAEGSG